MVECSIKWRLSKSFSEKLTFTFWTKRNNIKFDYERLKWHNGTIKKEKEGEREIWSKLKTPTFQSCLRHAFLLKVIIELPRHDKYKRRLVLWLWEVTHDQEVMS